MEIERKFLIPSVSNIGINLNDYTCKTIIQDYLYVDMFTSIRKRHIIKNGINKYKYTIKTDRKGISVNEIEKEISEEAYTNLTTNPNYNTITKTRYIIPYIEDLIIELDVFEGMYEGLVFAEIEFKDEKQAYSTPLPEWFGKEISGIVSNSKMATEPYNTIIEKLK